MNSDKSIDEANKKPELVFAFVGAAGVRLKKLSSELKKSLSSFGYEVVEIRLSDLMNNFTFVRKQKDSSEFDRITNLQEIGNSIRRIINRGDALGLASIVEIRTIRAKFSGNSDTPATAKAYFLHQLKHQNEVDLLRQVYGNSFFLIAGHAPRPQRKEELQRRMALRSSKSGKEELFESDASEVMRADDKQDDVYGQNVRDTYPKADFFANMGIDRGEHEIWRFVELLFGNPFRTPKPDEYAMYQANAVSLRSSDDNRQVGAVIVSRTMHNDKIRDISIVSVGMNEVARGGGGFYWEEDSPDLRDQNLLCDGINRADEIKNSVLSELIDKMIQKNWLNEKISIEPASDLADSLLKELKGTQFLDIGEFSRPVHAEMTALLDAARRGVAVDGQFMYVTTFPCHNCAKHIIAAGIRRVVYLEPYYKSRANGLYGEEISSDSLIGKEEDGRVVFFPYTGIAPRQYQLFFSMSERGAKKGRSLQKWNAEREILKPLYVHENASALYLEAEREAIKILPSELYNFHNEMLKKQQ